VAKNRDRIASSRVASGTNIVILGVVEEHLEDVRAELTTADVQPCLELVTYSRGELRAGMNRLSAADLGGPAGPVVYITRGDSLNRIEVGVAVADRATIEFITSRFDDPGMLLITGSGEILDGS
jgi:hypothetical protein